MDKANQMEFLFEEGGMADDGLDRDPVSGNEVPSGSMSEEVRDDIPAQLSEGEYVVPADVVRYFGVKYFEDLRDDAKMGLTQMEQEGRIGGEPVDVEGDDTELTAEEQAELDAIMGMAEGGTVTTTYDRLPPQAVGNTGQEQQLANVEQQMTRAFQEGGDAGFVDPDFSQFAPGFSFMGPDAVQTMPSIEASRNVTLYGPNGQVVNLILPSQQAQYDSLIAQGYSTQPIAAAAAPQVQQYSGSDEPDMTPQEYQSRLQKATTGSPTFSSSDFESIDTDPLGFINSELSRDNTIGRAGGVIAGLMGGPLIGGAIGITSELSPIARSRAALMIAESRGTLTAEEIATAREAIQNKVNGLPFPARAALNMGFASGQRYGQEGIDYFSRMDAIDRLDNDPNRPSYLGEVKGSVLGDRVLQAAATLTGAAAESYAQSAESGYTGTGPRGIAVGNISGRGQVNGVVVDPETGKAMRTADTNKTIFRDTEGRTYVRTGFLGRGIEYVSAPNAPQSDTPPPETTQGVSTGNGDNQRGGGGGDSGSDSDKEGSVICTALFNKGLLSKEIYALDTQYGIMLESTQPEVTYGYRKLATPLANYIQEDTFGATVTRTLVSPIAKAWANEMAHQMQPENYKGNLLGKAIIKLGYPVCAFVGKRSKEIVYGT